MSSDALQKDRLQVSLGLTGYDAQVLLAEISEHLKQQGEKSISGMIVQVPNEPGTPVVLIGRIFANTGGYGYRVELAKSGRTWRVKKIVRDVVS